jgi:hypothetical protein
VVFEVRGILLQHIFFNEKQLNDKQEKLRWEFCGDQL